MRTLGRRRRRAAEAWTIGCAACLLAGCAAGNESRQGVTATAAPAPGRVQLAGMSYEPQAGWVSEDPPVASRVGQYRLPGAGAGDATLIVYYFGDSGAGDVQGNLDRWFGQFEQPGGTPSEEVAVVRERTVGGLDVTSVDLGGTFVAQMTPGSADRHNEPGWRMLAAIVQTGAGPYYPKLVGPDETVARWKSSWDRFIGSLRSESATRADAPAGAQHPDPPG